MNTKKPTQLPTIVNIIVLHVELACDLAITEPATAIMTVVPARILSIPSNRLKLLERPTVRRTTQHNSNATDRMLSGVFDDASSLRTTYTRPAHICPMSFHDGVRHLISSIRPTINARKAPPNMGIILANAYPLKCEINKLVMRLPHNMPNPQRLE